MKQRSKPYFQEYSVTHSSVASPICREGQSEKTFPIFCLFFPISPPFPGFSWFFPIFSNFFAIRGGTLPPLHPHRFSEISTLIVTKAKIYIGLLSNICYLQDLNVALMQQWKKDELRKRLKELKKIMDDLDKARKAAIVQNVSFNCHPKSQVCSSKASINWWGIYRRNKILQLTIEI